MSAVQAIANALALRSPRREALDILSRVWEAAPLGRDAKLESVLAAVQAVFPHVQSFDRDFPSLCFALATGVGNTRLLGAFIAWLYRERGIRNFFVIAPNLTIYDKLKTDFSPNTPKYVFEGIMEFAAHPPLLITGDNYEDGVALQRSTRRVPVMPPETIRMLPFGTGLVLLRSAPPLVTDLRPWTTRPDAAELRSERAGIEDSLRRR